MTLPARWIFLLGAASAGGSLVLPAAGAQRAPALTANCGAPPNGIVAENCKPGNPSTEWDINGSGDPMIQDGLRSLRRGRTTFVIAHRLSTIQSADQILVLEHGEIVESGTHEELLARTGRYRQLYDKQYRFEKDRFINPGEDFTPEPEKVVAAARVSNTL